MDEQKMSLNLSCYLTVSQYAKRAKLTPQAIRKALKEKRLHGEKKGNNGLLLRRLIGGYKNG